MVSNRQKIKNKFYLKVIKKENDEDELWVSPEGTNEVFFLTNKKITLEEIEKRVKEIKGRKLFQE